METLKVIAYCDELLPKTSFYYNYIHVEFIAQDSVLYFSFNKFTYYSSLNLYIEQKKILHANNNSQWTTLVNLESENLEIEEIREDENTSYFIRLSNHCIIYISQEVNGDERLIQNVSLISPKDKEYQDVTQYMKEDFVDVIYDKENGINLIECNS